MANLLQRVWQEGTPLIDGETVTFVWYGAEPPVLRGDFNDWSLESAPAWQPYRAEETADSAQLNMWCCQLSFPRDAYIEYCFGPDEQRVADPFNKRRTSNGVGQFNHFFYMPEARPSSLLRQRRGPRGVVTRYQLVTDGYALGKRRTVYLYQPPTLGPVPLLVVFDGSDYLRRARLPIIVDNLIPARRIRPIALALVTNAGPQARFVEYACSESVPLFVHERVLPLAREHLTLLNLEQHSGSYGVLGASMGGLIALFTALRLPHIFGHVLSQSGAFGFDDYRSVVASLLRHGPVQPLRIWLDAGRYEWLLEANRDMHALLQQRGYDVTYREYNGGHNYPSWRDDVWRGLEALFS